MNEVMAAFFWKTYKELRSNVDIMNDFLEFHLPGDHKILMVEGEKAEIEDNFGNTLAVRSFPNGDLTHHKVTFEA